jgi:hypothetical protein
MQFNMEQVCSKTESMSLFTNVPTLHISIKCMLDKHFEILCTSQGDKLEGISVGPQECKT